MTFPNYQKNKTYELTYFLLTFFFGILPYFEQFLYLLETDFSITYRFVCWLIGVKAPGKEKQGGSHNKFLYIMRK